MERLTKSGDNGMAWYKSDLLLLEPCELSYSQVGEVLRRLAAYEDTGLTPEEVKETVQQIATIVPAIVEALPDIITASVDKIIERLKACKEAGL